MARRFWPFLILMALSPPLAVAELARAEDSSPILLTAESMRFNDQTGLVTARGDVEITQGKKILLADQVLYDRNTDIMTAEKSCSPIRFYTIATRTL